MIRPDDFEIGMWVAAISNGDDAYDMYDFYPYTPRKRDEVPDLIGKPAKVVAFSFPFAALDYGGEVLPIDVRKVRFCRVNAQYAATVKVKRRRPPSDPFPR